MQRVRDGNVKWISVQKGFTDEEQVEVFGDLQAGNHLILKGSDEYRDGAELETRLADSKK